MATWLWSDPHFNHANIIRYSSRPFKDVSEMNEQLVMRFNARVQPKDPVYCLGDFSLSEKSVPQFLPRLNGIHILIMGNHDACHPCRGKKAEEARERYLGYGFKELHLNHQLEEFDLSHMPFSDAEDARYPEWRPKRNGNRILLCGHVHERFKYRDGALNCGVDQWDYAPVSLEEVRAFLQTV